jgi:tryptophan synthase alpha chain
MIKGDAKRGQVQPASRLRAAFEARNSGGLPGLLPYITAGFPELNDTARILWEFERAGCVAAEVGIPHTDPLADGPTIQRTGGVALANGMTLALALKQIRVARREGLSIPLVVMTYFNPVHAYGAARFLSDAADSGVDGVIVPDLPYQESLGFRDLCHAAAVPFVAMVAPTTTDRRLEESCADVDGFVYCVSVTGTTGARDELGGEALGLLRRVRQVTDAPRALGFGISRRAHLEGLRGLCEGVIVASALLDAMWASGEHSTLVVRRFLAEMNGNRE